MWFLPFVLLLVGAITTMPMPKTDRNSPSDRTRYSIDTFVDMVGRTGNMTWPKLSNQTLCQTRREAVKNAFRDAWEVYRLYAWGADEIKPISKTKNNWLGGQATTIVDSISTMMIMGLDKEYEAAREWVANYDVHRNVSVSLFETGIRILAGLVSSYDLTGDIMYLRKAEEIGDVLITNFELNKESDIPSNSINIRKPTKDNPFSKRRSVLQAALDNRTDVTRDNPDFYTPQYWREYNLTPITSPRGDKGRRTVYNFPNSPNAPRPYIPPSLGIDDNTDPSSAPLAAAAREQRQRHAAAPPQTPRYSATNGRRSSRFAKGTSQGAQGESNAVAYLAEFGLFLEFVALSDRTGDPHYAQHALRAVQATLRAKRPQPGVVGQSMNYDGRSFGSNILSMGAMADSFYEYLVKQHIYLHPHVVRMRNDTTFPAAQTEGGEVDFATHWIAVHEAFLRSLRTNNLGFQWVADWPSGSGRWQHLACYGAGNLALGAVALNGWRVPDAEALAEVHEKKARGEATADDVKRVTTMKQFLDAGKRLAETCYRMYAGSVTGLSGETVNMDKNNFNDGDGTFILRPEVVESLFYLYRVTGDPRWQDYAWEIFQNIERVSKLPPHPSPTNSSVLLPSGYTSMTNVHSATGIARRDEMPSFFLAETLKYLYLIYTEPADVIPLDEWVFTTEAHPVAMRRHLKRVTLP